MKMLRRALLSSALAGMMASGCGLVLGLGNFKNGSDREAGASGGGGGALFDGGLDAPMGGGGGGSGATPDGASDAPLDAPGEAQTDGATCTCVAPAPTGWTGPLALFDSPVAAPSCDGGWSTFLDSGGSAVTGPPATCSGCGCTVSAQPNCDVVVETASNLGCTAATDTTTVAGNGVCVALNLAGGDQGVAFVHAAVGNVVAGSGSCTPSGGAPTLPKGTFTDQMRACDLTTAPASCASGEQCAPPVPSGFPEGRYCIAKKDAQANCSASGSYTHQYVVATAMSDTRGCTACTCAIKSGVPCSSSSSVSLGFDSNGPTRFTGCTGPLTGGPSSFQGSTPTECLTFYEALAGGPGPQTPAGGVTANAKDTNATCTTTGGGQPKGSVTLDPSNTWVFCCTK